MAPALTGFCITRCGATLIFWTIENVTQKRNVRFGSLADKPSADQNRPLSALVQKRTKLVGQNVPLYGSRAAYSDGAGVDPGPGRHRRALAVGLHNINPALVDPNRVETNIVRVDTAGSGMDAKAWVDTLAVKGIRAGPWTPTSLRFVTHRHIDDDAIEQTLAEFRAVYSSHARQFA